MKLLTINDETNTCECCGKTNLKRVAVIELDNGSVVRYGRDCAAKKLGKSMGKSVDALVEISAYIAKWSVSYSPEIVNKGINQKLGYYSEYKDGHYHTSVGVL